MHAKNFASSDHVRAKKLFLATCVLRNSFLTTCALRNSFLTTCVLKTHVVRNEFLRTHVAISYNESGRWRIRTQLQ